MSFLSDPLVGAAIGVGLVALTGGGAAALALGGLAGASVSSQIAGQELSAQQADESKKQANIKNAVAGLTASRNRSEMLRRARIARAQVEAQGAVTGTQAASSVVGGLSGLTSTTASNVGFSQATSDSGQQLFQSGQKLYDLEKQKGRADLVAGVSKTMFDVGVAYKTGQL